MPDLQCQNCGAPVTIGEPIPRDAECESCRRDLRCCRNCRYWDPRYNNECTETMADPVEDKTRRNFCEYFYFNRAPFAAAARDTSRESAARAKLDALFKGPSAAASSPTKSAPAAKPADARAKLDALFKKPKPDSPKDSDE